MTKLSFEEFLRLPQEERIERYKELSNHDRFRARMSDWSPEGTQVEEPELTLELIEQRRQDEELLQQFISENYGENGKLILDKGSR